MVAALAACGSAPVGPGFYRVERGDTLYKIARSNRTSVQSLARWNNLSNPDSLEVGQVLRVAPPAGTATAGTSAARSSAGTSASTSASASSAPRGTAADAPSSPASSISLIWPATGNVVRGFDGNNSKGIDIANAAGTPVFAAAGGTVVYASNGLRGYGNLLIIKHNADYLTAYAHNRTLLVKEGETVQQGQKIAEMGDSDNDRVMLHFELRYAGRSIDPARSLPPR
ncbi:peptidoglycan DD-metalloendopeptidase family protein [Burkholderia sp. Ac-20365]|nr:peptidoglycan DD-metalloendopeptidase family protein [Burkholderia sp. Ac-20365]